MEKEKTNDRDRPRGRRESTGHSPTRFPSRSPSPRRKPCNNFLKGNCTRGQDCKFEHPPKCRFSPKGECKKGEDCLFLHPKPPNSATAGGNSSAGSGQALGEETQAQKQSPRAKAKTKGKSAYVAKALLGLVGATQMSIGQSMLVFASVANLVEDYRSENALCAGGNPLLRQACGISRNQSDHRSKSLNVKFPSEIINKAKSRETREIPWGYQRHSNLTSINPDRRDHEIRREYVKTISWGQYFGTSKAEI